MSVIGKRALVVAPRAPDFDRGSGSQRVFDFMRFLQEEGWSVTFAAAGWCQKAVPRKLPLNERYVNALQQRGIPAYYGLNDRTRAMIAEGRFDLALLTYFHVADTWMPAIRELSPTTRVVVDNLDLNFMRTARQRFQQRERPGELGLLDLEYATEMIRELNVYAAADMVLAVSRKEADLVNDLTGEYSLARVVPDGDDLPASTVPFAERRGIVFVGTYLHPPNLDAATYLCTMIVPQLDPAMTREHPVSLVGDGLDRVDRAFGASSHLRLVGWVPSVLPYLGRARVAVMPLPFGAGTKRKVIHALMAGTPSVASSMAAEGLDLAHGEHLLISDDPVSFARSITRLLQDAELWQHLARRGREHMTAMRGRDLARQSFLEAVDGALAGRPRSGDRARYLDLQSPGFDNPELVRRVRKAVCAAVLSTSTVAVASGGNDDFLNLEGRRAWHFPRTSEGRWTGRNPATGEEVMRHLKELRAQGADYFVLPQIFFHWLTRYPGLEEDLKRTYRLVADAKGVCLVFSLHESPVVADRPAIDGNMLEALAAGRDGRLTGSREIDPAPAGPACEAALKRIRAAAPRVSCLIVGTYILDPESHIEQIVASLARSEGCSMTQRWIGKDSSAAGLPSPPSPPSHAGRGGDITPIAADTPPLPRRERGLGERGHPPQVGEVTVETVADSKPTFELINQLLAGEQVQGYDYVLVLDDDILLPEGFLDSFLAVQAQLGFALAQPAVVGNAAGYPPIVQQQWGALARQTLLVEPRPAVSVHRSIYDLVLPFDPTSPTGAGYERVWVNLLHRRGHKMGIVDAVPVRRKGRKYETPPSPELACSAFLREHDHYPLEACMRVLDVVTAEAWTR